MVLEHAQIRQHLRQRHPFLLVDRILVIEGDRAVGVKNVTATEPFIPGHFPDEPILPGVILLEAMSQVGGVLLAHDERFCQASRGYIAGVDRVRFKKFVVPGDQVEMEAVKIAAIQRFAKVRVTARVSGDEVASGEISYYLA